MWSHLLAAALLVLPAHAIEDPVDAYDHPCDRELLDDEEAFERNAWAHNCGYLPARAITWLFVHDLWVAFERPGAPLDSADPCADVWGAPVIACPAQLD